MNVTKAPAAKADAPSQLPAKVATSSVPEVSSEREQPIDIVGLPPYERRLFWAGYYAGVLDGIPMGRRQVEDEAEASWQRMAASIRVVASHEPYSALCERRGESGRAEAARATERRLGLIL